jgi:hypothetical protein
MGSHRFALDRYIPVVASGRDLDPDTGQAPAARPLIRRRADAVATSPPAPVCHFVLLGKNLPAFGRVFSIPETLLGRVVGAGLRRVES